MVPDSGLSAPVISAKSVLLPEPFCPMSAIFVPRRTGNDTSFKIGCLDPYSNETFSKRKIVSSRDIAQLYSIFEENETPLIHKLMCSVSKRIAKTSLYKSRGMITSAFLWFVRLQS